MDTKKGLIVEIISCIFFILFVYTGIAKLINFSTFELDLHRDPILKNVSGIIAIGIPIIELLIAVSLFIPKWKKLGLYSSFILMALFTLYVGYMLLLRTDRPCTCGGIIRNLSWPQHLVVNSIFTVIAFIGIILLRKKSTKEYRPQIA